MKELYDNEFYKRNKKFQSALARALTPIIVKEFNPQSVIDFGTGCGHFLKTIGDACETEDIYGLNFPVPNAVADVPVIECDLSREVNFDRKFDLVISLEVAEHISESQADIFIGNLCNHGDIILFSAATVGQGGIGHVNEQPHKYWHDKFYERDYVLHDSIRPKIKHDKNIPFWYRQNIFIYKKEK